MADGQHASKFPGISVEKEISSWILSLLSWVRIPGDFFFLLCILKRLSKQKAYLFWAKENLPLIILTLGLAHTFSSAWFSEYCLSVLGSICYSVFFRDLLERTLIDKDLYFFFLPAHSFCCLERLRSNTSQSFHTFFILFL